MNELREAVLRWYLANRRALPWRRTRDPYAIWVSEVMLQQTRVETVIPFYARFLRRFPDVRALARARESEVLAAWSGLGYYRRARNLSAAARIVAREHAGQLPDEPAQLRALPGIGAYTASAIASIAYGRPEAAVDGNVTRVLARLYGLRGRRNSPRLLRGVKDRAEALADGPEPGEWTQALMELGATRCLVREPLCDRCPAARWCAARRRGRPDRFPGAAAPKAPRAERRLLLLARSGGRVLLVPDPADSSATWTLPCVTLRGEPGANAAQALARRHLAGGSRLEGPRATFRHRTYSHHITYEVWTAAIGAKPTGARGGTLWLAEKDLSRVPTRAHTTKALQRLRE